MNLKILTWNVGTSSSNTRQTYPWYIVNNFIYYGKKTETHPLKPIESCHIYCLQEVLSENQGMNFVTVDSFDDWTQFYKIITPRGEYSLVTLISNKIGKCDVEIKNEVELKLEEYEFPFGQKISVGIGEKSFNIINLHLKMFPLNGPDDAADRAWAVHQRQVEKLGLIAKDGDIIAGDLNMDWFLTDDDNNYFLDERLKFEGDTDSDSYISNNQNDPQDKNARLDYIGQFFENGQNSKFEQTVLTDVPRWGHKNSSRHLPVYAEAKDFL